MQMLKRGVMTALMVTLCAPLAVAEDLIETDEVKVTVNRMEQTLHDTNVSAAVITEEDIRRNPQTSIGDLLNGIPGIIAVDGSMAGTKRISIRGESAARTLVLIDGIKISEQKSMDGAAILIDTSNIERIEVIKGPASVLYGSEAIGGVVNIITKKGGEKPIGGTLKLTYDASNASFESVGTAAGSYEGFFYRFSASGVDANDRDTPGGKLDNTSFRQKNFSGQLGYDWNHGNVWGQVDYYNNDMKLPGTSMGMASSPMWGSWERGRIDMELPKWERTTYKGGFELDNFSDTLIRISGTAYFQNLKKDFINNIWVKPMSPMLTMYSQNIETNNDQDSYGGTLQSEWLFFDSHNVIFGVDFNRDDLKADSWTKVSNPYGLPTYAPTRIYDYHYDSYLDTLGIFLQDEWSLLDNLSLVGGVRYTYIKSKLKTSTDPNSMKTSENDDNFVGNIGIVYEPMRELALRANVSQGHSFPNISQLYIGTNGHGGATTWANPNLKPEKSVNYEIGARWNSGDINVDAALFYSDAKDYITTRQVYAGNDNLLEYINMNKSKTWGFELSADYTYRPLGLTPYLTFTWLEREMENSSGWKTKDTGTPEVMGTAGIKWQRNLFTNHTFFADLNYMYNGSAKYSIKDSSTGAVETTKYNSWGTVNLSMGFESTYDDCVNYFGTLALRNIFDEEYAYSRSSLVEPGFHTVVMFGLSY